jgi:hypothetical protein
MALPAELVNSVLDRIHATAYDRDINEVGLPRFISARQDYEGALREALSPYALVPQETLLALKEALKNSSAPGCDALAQERVIAELRAFLEEAVIQQLDP